MFITGCGMMCSVGWDAASACAAIRAGISRPTPLEGFELLDEVTSEPRDLLGHPVSGYTDGFVPPGRWNRLAGGALHDLLDSAALPPGSDRRFWDECGFVLVTPFVNEERFQVTEPVALDTMRATILRYLNAEFALGIDPSLVLMACGGHAAGLAGLKRAQTLLQEPGISRVILLAMDSHLDQLSLEWLAEGDRMKLPDRPVGLEPGEAGAALLLETPAAVRRHNGRPKAAVTAVALGRAAKGFRDSDRQHGLEQARVLEQTIASRSPFAGHIISDLNGEEWRAFELASALSRIPERLHAEHQLVTPLRSTGDTGTACTIVAACLAIHSFERRYNPQGQAAVLGASEDGEVAAALLTAP